MTPVAIIGGGSSVTARDIEALAKLALAGKLYVIAVNNAVYLAYWAQHLHAGDSKWWLEHWPRVHRFGGRMTSLGGVPFAAVEKLASTGPRGYDDTPGCCRWGAGSGYQALHIALQMRAKAVFLLGFDMGGEHWHDPHTNEPAADYAAVMAPPFASLVEPAKLLGIEVFNCSPNSRLMAFPKASLQTVLATV